MMDKKTITFTKKGIEVTLSDPKMDIYRIEFRNYSIKVGEGVFAGHFANYYRGKRLEKYISGLNFVYNGKHYTYIVLDDKRPFEELEEALQKERDVIFDKAVDDILKGELKVKYKLGGRYDVRYYASVELPPLIKDLEGKAVEKAVRILTDNTAFITSDYLENRLSRDIVDRFGKADSFEIPLSDLIDMEEVNKKVRERDARKALEQSLELKVLRKYRNEDDFGVAVSIGRDGRYLEFSCENIFDFGYVAKPLYSVAKGIEGGLYSKGYWETFDSDKGWYVVRELDEFEKECIAYLYEFPPISRDIRL